MANSNKRLQFQNSDDENYLRKLEYEEDEYGYVEPKAKRASQSLISQLPSRRLDTLLNEELEEETDKSNLRRRGSQYRTLQLRNATLNSRNQNIGAGKIYKILKSNPNITEEETMKTLRDMHQSLTIKRQVKEKLDADRERKIASHALGCGERLKLRLYMTLHKLWYEFRNLFDLLEPWHTSIKTIHGQFGSNVVSYFIFLRWLLYLNLCNFCITFCFVLIPQLIQKGVNPPATSFMGNKTEAFKIHNFLTGAGWFIDSLLYFGAYSSHTIQPIFGIPYNMPLAYLMSLLAMMLINLIAVSVSITTSYQKNYVDTAGEFKNVFCNKLFSSWHYTIETENAALLRRLSLCNDIKELLYAKRMSMRRMTLYQSILQKVSLACVSLFALVVVMSVGYLTYYLLEKESVKVDIPILRYMTFSMTVTIISSVFFYLLKFATVFEAFLSKKMRLYLTMIRVVILRTVMLGIVTYFWMITYKPPRDQNVCYEAELGSEFYRLIFVNFLVAVIIFTFITEFVCKLIHKYVTPRIGLKEFDVAYHTLDLVYFQTLAWLAIYCIPLASLLISIILVVLFYIKKISMSSNCRPPKISWPVNEMQTFYLVLTFVMLFFASITVGYTILALETSFCGPFRNYNYAGDIIRSVFQEDLGNLTARIVTYLTSSGVLFAVFCALCLSVHYMRAQAKAHISVIKKHRETLLLASKDKVFLLKLFDEAFTSHLKNMSELKSDKKKSLSKDDVSKRECYAFACGDTSLTDNNHQGIVINEAYKDSYEQSLVSPTRPTKFRPNYIPADVPVNKIPHNDDKQKYGASKQMSPYRTQKESPYPPHQTGFQHLLPGQNHS